MNKSKIIFFIDFFLRYYYPKLAVNEVLPNGILPSEYFYYDTTPREGYDVLWVIFTTALSISESELR